MNQEINGKPDESKMNIETLLSLVNGVRSTGHGRWICKCPAHDDRSPSLSVRECDDGRILVHCFAGCEVESVLAAVGLEFSDLYPERAISHRERPMRFNPRDLLLLARREMMVVVLAAESLAKGMALNELDHERLVTATGRIAGVANEAR